jgi:hypothetical protein
MLPKLSQASNSSASAGQVKPSTYDTTGQLYTVNEETGLPGGHDPERVADFDKAYNKLVRKFY